MILYIWKAETNAWQMIYSSQNCSLSQYLKVIEQLFQKKFDRLIIYPAVFIDNMLQELKHEVNKVANVKEKTIFRYVLAPSSTSSRRKFLTSFTRPGNFLGLRKSIGQIGQEDQIMAVPKDEAFIAHINIDDGKRGRVFQPVPLEVFFENYTVIILERRWRFVPFSESDLQEKFQVTITLDYNEDISRINLDHLAGLLALDMAIYSTSWGIRRSCSQLFGNLSIFNEKAAFNGSMYPKKTFRVSFEEKDLKGCMEEINSPGIYTKMLQRNFSSLINDHPHVDPIIVCNENNWEGLLSNIHFSLSQAGKLPDLARAIIPKLGDIYFNMMAPKASPSDTIISIIKFMITFCDKTLKNDVVERAQGSFVH